MFDYYEHLQGLNEDKLHEEIRKLYDRLFKTSQTSPVYQQLLSMLDMAEQSVQEHIYKRKVKTENSVIEIGKIQSDVKHIDYSKTELLDIMVTEYRKDPGDSKQ